MGWFLTADAARIMKVGPWLSHTAACSEISSYQYTCNLHTKMVVQYSTVQYNLTESLGEVPVS